MHPTLHPRKPIAGHLPLPTPPARRDSPARPHSWAGSVPTLNISLPLLHNRCKIWVKKSTCFIESGLEHSRSQEIDTPNLTSPPSVIEHLVSVRVLNACGLSFYLKRNQILSPAFTYPTRDATPGALSAAQVCYENGCASLSLASPRCGHTPSCFARAEPCA